jgi:DNA-directed RNA polymerase subunit beta'
MSGKIGARQKVNIAGHNGVTACSALYNLMLPQPYQNFKKVWGAKDVQSMLRRMYEDAEAGKNNISKMQISTFMDKIKNLGFQASTRAGLSLSINDFKKIDFSDIINKKIEEKKKETNDEREALILGYRDAEKEIEKSLKEGIKLPDGTKQKVLEDSNPLQVMMASGARAKADQIRRMMVTVGVGMDLNKQLTSPVSSSHLEGLAPQEYWLHAFDSRKGMADRSVSTREPGALTREVWSASQDLILTEEDCHTHDGIDMKPGDPGILGRYVAQDKVIGENGTVYAVYNQLITQDIREKMYKDHSVKTV